MVQFVSAHLLVIRYIHVVMITTAFILCQLTEYTRIIGRLIKCSLTPTADMMKCIVCVKLLDRKRRWS